MTAAPPDAVRDPIRDLAHDHAELNRRVLAIGALVRARAAPAAVAPPLTELREILFLHFAREEEGLFPFVAEHLPDHAAQVREMAVAHDAICGALARMIYLAGTADGPATLALVYERFATGYAHHAAAEHALLGDLAARLGVDQRAALHALIEGL